MSRKKNTIYKTIIKEDNCLKTLKKRNSACRAQSGGTFYFHKDINQFCELSGLGITQALDRYLEGRGRGKDLTG
jgi:hypothetical protein